MENEMVELLQKAEQSDVKAMIKVADMFRANKDDEKAFKYVYKSALYHYPEGERKLGYYYERGIGCTKDLTKAKSYYELAAIHGDTKAMYNIAIFYFQNKQYNQAFSYAKQAADNNHPKACSLMNYFYEHAIGCEQDYTKAYEFLLKAYELKEKGLCYKLGIYFYNGYGVNVDYEKAFSYFYLGADEQEKECYYYLAAMFYKGEGTKQDYGQAFYYFEKGANSGDPKAMYNLATFYELGIYVQSDLTKAKYWLLKAKEKGFDLAINRLQIEKFTNINN
ncbi:MAG: tetratricopeptide repeat protein [Bacilli bacterium]|nr:tetratricopeptide repeat protein [Bacilli bacterium]